MVAETEEEEAEEDVTGTTPNHDQGPDHGTDVVGEDVLATQRKDQLLELVAVHVVVVLALHRSVGTHGKLAIEETMISQLS